MFLETTFMQYGYAPGGVIGITLKPETLKVWALSLHAYSRLDADLNIQPNLNTVIIRKKEK
jgi:hypothetical protein